MLKVTVLLMCLTVVHGADILAVFTIPSVSHQIVYRSLTMELNRRGHRLTVITPNPVRNSKLKNYREIDVSFQYELWNREMVANPKDLSIVNSFPEIFIFLFSMISPEMCRSYLSHPDVRSFLQEKRKFDLLITEFGVNPCVYGFSKLSDYKHVGIYSFQTTPVVHANIGNPTAASFITDPFFPYSDSMSFLQRIRLLLFQAFVWAAYSYTMWSQNVIAKDHFGSEIPHLVDIERNLSLLLVNSHFSLFYPRSNVPNLVEIGGPPFHLYVSEPQPLPQVMLIINKTFHRQSG
ncbi:hypothetical protein RUM44_012935 [Polyplax serrata]|uniref:Uncharacterized protein n=1 Tax=Polyplax serrata TaxID=468196 RepID=A0ABR1BGF0_POLSC